MFNAKVSLYAAIGWGLLVIFSLLGALLGKPAAPYVLCISVIIWAAMRIVKEAFAAIYVLRVIKDAEKKKVEEEQDD